MSAVHVSTNERELKIAINGVPHFRIDRRVIVGMQSWLINRGRETPCYAIEFTTRSKPITLQYDRRETWEDVLRQLDAITILNEWAVQDP